MSSGLSSKIKHLKTEIKYEEDQINKADAKLKDLNSRKDSLDEAEQAQLEKLKDQKQKVESRILRYTCELEGLEGDD